LIACSHEQVVWHQSWRCCQVVVAIVSQRSVPIHDPTHVGLSHSLYSLHRIWANHHWESFHVILHKLLWLLAHVRWNLLTLEHSSRWWLWRLINHIIIVSISQPIWWEVPALWWLTVHQLVEPFEGYGRWRYLNVYQVEVILWTLKSLLIEVLWAIIYLRLDLLWNYFVVLIKLILINNIEGTIIVQEWVYIFLLRLVCDDILAVHHLLW